MNEAMTTLEKRHAAVKISGKGMIMGLDVGDGNRAKAIVEDCFQAGLLIASCGTGGRVVKLIPPLTIPDDDLKDGLNILLTATDKVMEAA